MLTIFHAYENLKLIVTHLLPYIEMQFYISIMEITLLIKRTLIHTVCHREHLLGKYVLKISIDLVYKVGLIIDFYISLMIVTLCYIIVKSVF